MKGAEQKENVHTCNVIRHLDTSLRSPWSDTRCSVCFEFEPVHTICSSSTRVLTSSKHKQWWRLPYVLSTLYVLDCMATGKTVKVIVVCALNLALPLWGHHTLSKYIQLLCVSIISRNIIRIVQRCLIQFLLQRFGNNYVVIPDKSCTSRNVEVKTL
jgi:hypothetical protein